MATQDRAFEIFVKRAVTTILKESTGRSKDSKDLKDACQAFLTTLDQHESGTISYDGSLAHAVLHPLQLACNSTNVKVVEQALGALHKLVAHAWLQGESSASEDLIADDSDTVQRVIKLVIKCGEISNPGLQLSVIRALLTFTTAEHFVAHGDSLMSAVRTVFNLALGSEDENIKRTACNALLQMLNTVAKRVTAYQLHSFSTTPSRRESEQGEGVAADLAAAARRSTISPQTSLHRSSLPHQASDASTHLPHRGSDPALQQGSEGGDAGQTTELSSDARTAQFASLAEQRDLRGLEAAIGSALPDQPSGQRTSLNSYDGGAGDTASLAGSSARPSNAGLSTGTSPRDGAPASASGTPTVGPPGAPAARPAPAQPPPPPVAQLNVVERDVLLVLTAFCKLASREAGLTEVESYLHQGKLLALELLVKVLQNPQHRWENVAESLMRHLRQPLCITLLRNCAATDPAAFQLAIKLLLSVMMQPKLRRGLKAELGAFYPLFVLRPLEQGAGLGSGDASVPPSPLPPGSASGGGARGQPEQTDLNTLFVVLTSLKQLCSEPQLVADLFANYDCDLQAPPLFERTLTALGRLAQKVDASDLLDRPSATAAQPLAKQQAEIAAKLAAIRDVALKCTIAVVSALDQWAAPLKDTQAAQPGAGGSGAASANNGEGAGDSASAGSFAGSAAGASEAERLEAQWAHKSTLSKGIASFNASPVKGVKWLLGQGVMEPQPGAVAAWLRAHAGELDKGALGEYFGHHEDFAVEVMHAFIDGEQYEGQTVDGALRSLLAQFRLPGEAQKIDRIMEKFAECYVCCNPGLFYNADGCYLLSFAVIMLNTDAHNPLAERRLGKADFVIMCQQPIPEEDGGGMEPVLPPAELEGIYDRIVAQEIQVHDPQAVAQRQQAAAANASAKGRSSARNRLAAALGLHALAAPFKPLSRSWGKVAEGLGDTERKKRIVQLAERAITRGAGGLWTTAVHAELARPMLTLGAGPALDALAFGVMHAPTAAAADPVIRCLVQLVQLAGLLRLDEVCERAVVVIAAACGVHAPAPYGSPQEAKQLAALQALMALPSLPEAAALGSAWTTILRAMSVLDALTEELTEPSALAQAGNPSSGMSMSSGGSGVNPFNKMFQALGINLGGSPVALGNGGSMPAPGHHLMLMAGGVSSGSSQASQAGVPLRAGPGASLVVWARGEEGQRVVRGVVGRSTELDGDAVVVLFRAMCAVSREELEQGRPRTFFLQQLVDAAHANAGRIRLIWGKLWAVVSAHLVAAACHTGQGVALYAVDALAGLAQRLLGRAELAHFRAQGEALRPFTAVLRQCDDPVVRATCVSHALAAAADNPRGLGLGWRTLLEVLWRGAGDHSPAVAARATEGMAVAVAALYRGAPPAGHDYLRESVRAALAAAHNLAAGEQVGLAGIGVLVACAARLSEYVAVHGQPLLAPSGGAHRTSTLMSVATGAGSEHWDAPGLQHSGAALTSPQASVGGAPYIPAQPPLSGGSFTAAEAPHGLASQDSGPLAGGSDVPDAWGLLLGALSDIAQSDSRPRVAGAATQAIFDVLQEHSARWSDAAWHVLMNRVVPSLFRHAGAARAHPGAGALGALQRVPPSPRSPAHQAEPGAAGTPGPSPSSEFIARVTHYFPLMCEQLGHVAAGYRGEMLSQLAHTCLQWMQEPHEALASVGLHGFEQLVSQVAAQSNMAGWQQLLDSVGPMLQAELEAVMGDTQALQQAWIAQQPSSTPQLALPHGLRVRARTLIMAHRLLARLYQQHAAQLSWSLRQALLQPLLSCAHACASFNLLLEGEVLRAVAQRPATLHQPPHQQHLQHQTPGRTSAAHSQEGKPAAAAASGSPFAASLSIAQAASEGGVSPQQGAPAAATPTGPTPARSIDDEVAADGILAAEDVPVARNAAPHAAAVAHAEHGGGTPPPAKGPRTSFQQSPAVAHTGMSRSGHAGVLLYSTDSHVLQHLGLARLEMECLTAALELLEATADGAAGSDDEATQGAMRMLTDLCYFVIAQCADALSASAEMRGAFVASGLPHATQHSAPAYTGTWLDGMRAPVLARVILTYMQLPGAGDAADIQRLFPHMLVLMCSHQESVRDAVAAYFSACVEPVIAGAAAKGSAPAAAAVSRRP